MLTLRQLAAAAIVPAFFVAGTFFAFSEPETTAEPDAGTPTETAPDERGEPAAAEPAESPGAPAEAKPEEAGIPLTYTRLSIGKDGVIRYENADLNFENLGIHADELAYDANAQAARASGSVSIDMDAMRVVTDSVDYDQKTGSVSAKNVRGGADFFFFKGEEISAGTGGDATAVAIRDSEAYVGEPHWSSVSFGARRIDYDSEEDWLHLGPSIFRVAGVPVLPLPPLSVPRIERPPVRIWANSGESSTPGFYLRTTTHLTIWDDYEPGLLLDFYERSGPLVGPALAYDTRGGNADSARWMFGDFQAGYINDTANREPDIYRNEIGGRRGFIEWTHKQEIDGLEISAAIHRWSDSEVTRHFRPDVYDANRNPDSHFEFVLPSDNYYISALTRVHLNDYQSTQQRLPEIRFDLVPTEILNTGVRQRFSASYACLVEEDSDQYHLRQTNKDDRLESSRADFYYGLDAPIAFGDFATFTPVAGVRSTFYGNAVPDADDNYWRTVGQIGFDLQFCFSGTNGYRNETWGIDGLRHVCRPVFRYRYMPGVASQSSRIPEIDRDIYRDAPTILDLGDNRAVDTLYDEHIFRIGLENLFQTRDKSYGSKDLAEFNVYQDIRKTDRPVDDDTLSDNFAELVLKPANWVNFSLTHRMDVSDFSSKSIRASVRFTDGDVWGVTLSGRFLANDDLAYYGCDTHARQYTVRVDWRLNSYYQFYGDWRFDDEKNIFTDQYYGLRQRLGNSWNIEYYVRYRQDAGDESDFSFGVSLSLFAY